MIFEKKYFSFWGFSRTLSLNIIAAIYCRILPFLFFSHELYLVKNTPKKRREKHPF